MRGLARSASAPPRGAPAMPDASRRRSGYCSRRQPSYGWPSPGCRDWSANLPLAGSFEIRQHRSVAAALLTPRRDLLGEIFLRAPPPVPRSSTSPSSSRRRSLSNRSSVARMRFSSEFRAKLWCLLLTALMRVPSKSPDQPAAYGGPTNETRQQRGSADDVFFCSKDKT